MPPEHSNISSALLHLRPKAFDALDKTSICESLSVKPTTWVFVVVFLKPLRCSRNLAKFNYKINYQIVFHFLTEKNDSLILALFLAFFDDSSVFQYVIAHEQIS